MRELPILPNEAKETCAGCGGKCCKTLPGAYLPDQFSNLEQELREGFAAGTMVLAWWNGDPRMEANCYNADCEGECQACTIPDKLYRAYYPRPRNLNSKLGEFDSSTQGQCIHLGVSGCRLDFSTRPAGCQNLLVNLESPGNCSEYDDPRLSYKWSTALAWVPHQQQLLDAAHFEPNHLS